MKRTNIALILILVLAIGAILVFSKGSPIGSGAGVETPRCPGCNVIVILVDTLRADHLPCYGYERNTAPNLCGLAEEGFLFENMHANSPSTKTSVASLFTSMLPSQHKSIYNQDVLNDDLTTLAEMLAEHGYHTYAVNANPVIKTKFNYDQGFETWTDRLAMAGKVNRVIFAALDGYEQPFFLYLHYMDPHSPYTSPGRYHRYFNPGYEGPLTGRPPYEADYFASHPDELEQLVALYDNDIRYVDDNIGELLEKLKEKGLYRDSLIVFLADHGEMFLEHGSFEHSNSVYTEVIDVPLIIRPPNQTKRIVETPVQTVDILPTLLSMLDIEVDGRFMGRSIFPLIGRGETRPIISEQHRGLGNRSQETALILGDFKLIKQLKQGTHLLFDTRKDPQERVDIFDSAPNAAELAEKMGRLLEANASMYEGFDAKTTTLDEETTRQLKELGYIQ